MDKKMDWTLEEIENCALYYGLVHIKEAMELLQEMQEKKERQKRMEERKIQIQNLFSRCRQAMK